MADEKALLERTKKKLKIVEQMLEQKTREAYTEAEKARSSFNFMQKVFDNTPDPMILMDKNHLIQDVNKSFENKFLYKKEEIIHKSFFSLCEKTELLENLDIAEINKSTASQQFFKKNKDSMTVMMSASKVDDSDIDTPIIVFLKDISLRAKLDKSKEEEKEKLDSLVEERTKELAIETKKAEKANHAKSLFLANMSHEIRTPLNAIIAISSLMLKSNEPEHSLSRLEKISLASESLLSLVNDILDFSKIEAGEFAIEKTTFDLKSLIQKTVSTFEEVLPSDNDISLELSIDESLHEAYHGDPLRLRQVITNLVNNAIKFTQQGHIQIRVIKEQSTDSSTQDDLRFEIEDDGIGMSLKTQKSLFRPFLQADISTTRKFGGTGLGLSICKEIIKKMHGSIGVNSEENKGSLFYFEISLEKSEKSEIDFASENQSIIKDLGKILVVEDNKMNQEVMSMLLSNMDLQFKIASNGQIAVDMYEQDDFYLILMDCQMPIMDGFTATENIRSLEKATQRPPTPIVAMTANAILEDKERCFKVGMDDYLSKPVDMDTVTHLIQTWQKRILKQKSHCTDSTAFEKNDSVGPQNISHEQEIHHDHDMKKLDSNQSTIESKNQNHDVETPLKDIQISIKPDISKNTMEQQNMDFSKLIDESAIQMLKSLVSAKNPDFFNKQVNSFITQSQKEMQNITTAATDKNFHSLREVSHRFKTSCGIIGAKTMTQMCQDLEEKSLESDIDACQTIIENLEKDLLLVLSYLKTQIS